MISMWFSSYSLKFPLSFQKVSLRFSWDSFDFFLFQEENTPREVQLTLAVEMPEMPVTAAIGVVEMPSLKELLDGR